MVQECHAVSAFRAMRSQLLEVVTEFAGYANSFALAALGTSVAGNASRSLAQRLYSVAETLPVGVSISHSKEHPGQGKPASDHSSRSRFRPVGLPLASTQPAAKANSKHCSVSSWISAAATSLSVELSVIESKR